MTMQPSTTLWSLVVLGALALGCGDSTSASGDDTTGTTGTTATTSSSTTEGGVEGSSTGGPTCTPGTEGCACDDGACEGELSCFSQICVMQPAAESSGSLDTSGTGDTTTAVATEASGSSETTASGSESESSSSTAAPVETCEEEGNHVCEAGVLDTCEDGVVVSQSCDDDCAQTGFLSTGCSDINSCGCDGYADATCENITGKFCDCYALFGNPCDEAFELSVYGWCFDPTINESSHDIVVCFGDFPTNTLAECNAASDVCFNL